MSKKERAFLLFLAAASAVSLSVTYYQTVVKRGFDAVNFEDAPEEEPS